MRQGFFSPRSGLAESGRFPAGRLGRISPAVILGTALLDVDFKRVSALTDAKRSGTAEALCFRLWRLCRERRKHFFRRKFRRSCTALGNMAASAPGTAGVFQVPGGVCFWLFKWIGGIKYETCIFHIGMSGF
jgi:hypothetical protein